MSRSRRRPRVASDSAYRKSKNWRWKAAVRKAMQDPEAQAFPVQTKSFRGWLW